VTRSTKALCKPFHIAKALKIPIHLPFLTGGGDLILAMQNQGTVPPTSLIWRRPKLLEYGMDSYAEFGVKLYITDHSGSGLYTVLSV
jgi:hypothetical protein